MSLEERLISWTGPSSTTEQDKQERTERMIREAVKGHSAFSGYDIIVYAKGSYANNTNVKADSDVDIAVQCGEVVYWEEATKGAHPAGSPYKGIWTPTNLRAELEAALKKKFPGQIDSSGSTAFRISSNSARVDADVVPCFDYRYYFSSGEYREGTKVFKKDGTGLVNYPVQQLTNGRTKNNRTNGYYKKAVRIMKRVENAMVLSGEHREVPSFFVECLVYNCPDSVFLEPTWAKTVHGVIVHIWSELEGAEPAEGSKRWREVNGHKYLFHRDQAWNRQDGRDFVKAAWNYLGLAS
ncbi:nucleotidyltransferase domain-containing protein [Micromonospora sp. NBC_01796]|uniref:nucleotidyltransferase domain-containing protein n=1 Tax=Micromonospora sp. NBC_01796 TaxID=2975987 RepID=UPI002DD94ED1|nr:nucleotidyltransferase [Micromonospora sp. NBC_01796]WSA86696.1 nucleotidyltransferase [Micromonospora sp. NBC_01796]